MGHSPQRRQGADLAFIPATHTHITTTAALGQVGGHPRAGAGHAEMNCPQQSYARDTSSPIILLVFRRFLQTFGAACACAQRWALCSACVRACVHAWAHLRAHPHSHPAAAPECPPPFPQQTCPAQTWVGGGGGLRAFQSKPVRGPRHNYKGKKNRRERMRTVADRETARGRQRQQQAPVPREVAH